MKTICLYLHVHQPYRLTKLSYLDLGGVNNYFVGSPYPNKFFINKVAEKSYLPTNKILLTLLKEHPEFKLSLSITGVVLEQLQEYAPKVLKSFQELVATGKVEILAETYYHSLASLYSIPEFCLQVQIHAELIKKLFGVTPENFRNTELIYNDRIASIVNELGFKGIITEGWDPILAGKESTQLYQAKLAKLTTAERKTIAKYSPKKRKRGSELKLLLKNYKLSDDIAFRFSDSNWKEYPLTPAKFFSWIAHTPGEIINLFMDYETFGEHQWEATGIFKFLQKLPAEAKKHKIGFQTIAGAMAGKPVGTISITDTISWADLERDTSAWNGNKMQQTALRIVYELEQKFKTSLEEIPNKTIRTKFLSDWRKLQTSDHFYYMSTKYWTDGDVHKYFSPYDSPYEAFINFMNIVEDFTQKFEYQLTKHA